MATSAAMTVCAPIFADGTTEVLNGQLNLDAAISVVATGDTPAANTATMTAIGMANALTGDFATAHDVTSDQTFSGSVATSATTSAGIIYGTAITTSSAIGNSASLTNDTTMDASATQTALDGSAVRSDANLNVSNYAMTSVTTATASANAYGSVSYGGDNTLDLRQDSGADVSADSYVLASGGGLGWSASSVAAANGNSASIEGYYMGPSHIADIDQSNRGDVSASANLEAGGGGETTQVIASANGNSAWMQNENGYAHMQGSQDNSGQVDAVANADIGNFDIDTVSLSAEGVGNSAIISNIGADAYMGLDQTNNGTVNATTNFTGGAGGAALASATAFGNAATTYVCSECAVTAWGRTNQTNNAGINANVTGQMTSGSLLSGTATAIGNSATFQSVNPYSGN
ncbi:holdfast anchor protein HfaD [uncultured Maricaulis sp.]|uniref:holdfast anchor protein HfaD n=1 Tax=uncultured Maricaulis sp. TaxID=174710 RepID=UPI0030D7275F|tara:strand:+ start:5957 stop:7168 length:1212 start_codon:yes stop_codon:yes gene_type:complete